MQAGAVRHSCRLSEVALAGEIVVAVVCNDSAFAVVVYLQLFNDFAGVLQ
jgi:hypothetical protein